jgi:pimeloyl-ACP methyl ester carboxylesterase
MIRNFFHAWERRLLAATTNRVIRPFEWGLEWIPSEFRSPETDPARALVTYAARAVEDSDAFYAHPPCPSYTELAGHWISFPSALRTPHAENNTVYARFFRARREDPRARRAVVVLPQWNASVMDHVGLCQLLARFGISALRLSMPYHDRRMPPELQRADYIVSANVGRTLEVCRQAVLDARRAIHWLAHQGYERIGILGTSLGSCLSLLTAAHEPLVRVAALNHVSPYFGDVVWEGVSTAHVRVSLEEKIDLDTLRRIWLPISPQPFLDRVRNRKTLLVYARYDLTFPVRLSLNLLEEFKTRDIPHETAALPCGHYTTGRAPFKWLDGYLLTEFLVRNL